MEKFILKLSSKLSRVALLLFFTQLIGCAPGEEGFGSGIDAYTFVQNNFYEISDSKLHGSGSIRFIQSYGTGFGTSLALGGSLDFHGSSITAIFFADTNLNNGLSLQIKRDGVNVSGFISYPGNTSVIISNVLWANPAKIDIVIDAHRVGPNYRILIWQRDTYGYSPATALIDSQINNTVSPALPPVGSIQGSMTGISVFQAEVTKANVGYARAL